MYMWVYSRDSTQRRRKENHIMIFTMVYTDGDRLRQMHPEEKYKRPSLTYQGQNPIIIAGNQLIVE